MLGALREHFSEAEAVELMFIVGYQTFASKFAKAFALAPQGLAAPALAPTALAARRPGSGEDAAAAARKRRRRNRRRIRACARSLMKATQRAHPARWASMASRSPSPSAPSR